MSMDCTPKKTWASISWPTIGTIASVHSAVFECPLVMSEYPGNHWHHRPSFHILEWVVPLKSGCRCLNGRWPRTSNLNCSKTSVRVNLSLHATGWMNFKAAEWKLQPPPPTPTPNSPLPHPTLPTVLAQGNSCHWQGQSVSCKYLKRVRLPLIWLFRTLYISLPCYVVNTWFPGKDKRSSWCMSWYIFFAGIDAVQVFVSLFFTSLKLASPTTHTHTNIYTHCRVIICQIHNIAELYGCHLLCVCGCTRVSDPWQWKLHDSQTQRIDRGQKHIWGLSLL